MSFKYLVLPIEIFNDIKKTQGVFFNKISGLDPQKITSDLLDPQKAILQAEILKEFIILEEKKILEIGSGFGINHIIWRKKFNVNGYSIEPDGFGFDSSFKMARQLVALNGLDPNRIVAAVGEALPFEDNFFDIVYSTNVLEHVADPAKVLDEGLRVLKPGGVLQFVYPNYHSYFDGHYAVFHPPLFCRSFFPWYVKSIFRRDPQFAKSLRTELNIGWTKKQLANLQTKYNVEVLSLGQEIFLKRMHSLDFETWAGLTKVKRVLGIMHELGLNYMAARLILWLKAWTPIILTIRKREIT